MKSYDVNQISSSILKISQASTFKEDLIKKGLKELEKSGLVLEETKINKTKYITRR